MSATFAIGIDLGTTNTALASAPLGKNAAEKPEVMAVPQVVAAGEIAARPLLPSFLFVPADGQFPAGSLRLPWGEGTQLAGAFARSQGSTTPARLISSAKSWLSTASADRNGAILPWQAPAEVPKLSPVDVSARYLEHLKAAWDAQHPGASLAEQDVVLTVPASFDAVARELTAAAAQRAGLPANLRLLEEPQAALYAWLADKGADWRSQLAVGDTILVCDIGGGTTDFSLIEVRETDGNLELHRVAVGDHILLGGDNMDLALAYTVRARLENEGTKLDDWQMRALTYACRAAKETMLGGSDSDTQPLVIPGRSSKLIGGTITTELRRNELESVLLEGFFPVVEAAARPQAPRRVGLTTLGLPYASDAAVTRHLAAFLGRDGQQRNPSTILFNGGVTRSPVLRDRLHAVLKSWAEAAGAPAPKVLSGIDPDLAVCRGAAYYARVVRDGGVRIRGGTAQAYYVGIERAELAVPGVAPKIDALCVAPFGMEEGTDAELPTPLGLIVGEPVSFRFFGSSTRGEDKVGEVVDPSSLTELAPIETTFEDANRPAGQAVEVRLHARLTEVGTLEMEAVAGDQRWKLSFDVRVK